MPRRCENKTLAGTAFGASLRTYRKIRGWSFRDAAKHIGDSASNISRIELGTRKPWVSGPRLRSIAKVLQIPPGRETLVFIAAALAEKPGIDAELADILRNCQSMGMAYAFKSKTTARRS